MVTAADIFEELRFILELLIAEHLFVGAFASKKPSFRFRVVFSTVLLCLIAASYPWLQNLVAALSAEWEDSAVPLFTGVWYIALTALTIPVIRWMYPLSLCDTLFMGIGGYAVQHIEYILINEVVALGLWPGITGHLLLYILICAVSYAVLCLIIYFGAVSDLKRFHGQLFDDTPANIIIFSVMLVLLLFSAFMHQYVFLGNSNNYSGNINYLGALSDLLNCSFFLIVQFSIFRISTLSKENEVVRQLLYERGKQYQLSRENIDIINHKCHDLKHQVTALRQVGAQELGDYIDEVESSVMIYDNVLQTDNEVLNTILSEKSLYCEQHKIRLSCIVDSDYLDFMSTMDIYALLGNALDNAIECVRKYKEADRRVVSLTISTRGNFLCIQTNNYYEGTIELRDGLPVTTKTRHREMHGFGMQSMKHLAEKYGGSLYIDLSDQIFLLQIVIPMPPEFLRLLKEKQSSR